MAKNQSNVSSADFWNYPDMTKALEIALYYGFTPSKEVAIEKSDREHAKQFIKEEEYIFFKPEEKVALLRKYFSEGSSLAPVMIATTRADTKQDKPVEYLLDVIGTNRSIADATLIKTAYETIRAEGYCDINLELNSIGDRESFLRYTRELGNFFRKHINEFHVECRQIAKKNLYATLTCEHEECKEIISRAPHSMNYLSEPSRSYFMELLELLEKIGIPFTINNSLIANQECAMHTIFRIYGTDTVDTKIVAYGARYGVIAKKMGYKKDIQGMSATILIPRPAKKEKFAKIPKPQCYFIQMGNEAKLKSLTVIEVLRQSKIPVYHSLTKDKLTAQLMSAESLNVPYIIIMGQKESLENTLLIREMSNRSQETIKMDQVADYLRKIIR
jgi:histidyl-tRNA synthetase